MSISHRVKWNATTSMLKIMISNYQSEIFFCLRDQSETQFCLRDGSETHFGSSKPGYWELKLFHLISLNMRSSCKRHLSLFNYILETISLYFYVLRVFLYSRIKRRRNKKKLKSYIRPPRSRHNVILILWSKIEYNLILANLDQSRNILETIRTREHDGNKSKEIAITEFVVGSTLRVYYKNFTKIQQHISALTVKHVAVVV